MLIAVAVFEGVEELDWAGHSEVLPAWVKGWPEDGVAVTTVAESREPIAAPRMRA